MTVSIAQLKNGLSGCLQGVRAGETAEEADLAAAGLLILPAEPFDPDAILRFGAPVRLKSRKSVSEIISEDRDASDARILG